MSINKLPVELIYKITRYLPTIQREILYRLCNCKIPVEHYYMKIKERINNFEKVFNKTRYYYSFDDGLSIYHTNDFILEDFKKILSKTQRKWFSNGRSRDWGDTDYIEFEKYHNDDCYCNYHNIYKIEDRKCLECNADSYILSGENNFTVCRECYNEYYYKREN